MTISKPLISVIIPIYNVEQYLERCIKSVMNQTYKTLEIILVDDGSPDNSGKIADDFAMQDSRIKVIHQCNKGLGEARNTGIQAATGKFISFIDSDDWITPDMIEYLYNLISLYDTDYASIDNIITSNENDVIVQPKEKINVLNQSDMFDLFFRTSSKDINYCSTDKLYRMRVAKSISFVEGKRFEDIDYCYKVIKQCKSAVVSNRICYFYFTNTNGITLGKLRQADYDLLDIWNSIILDCKENLPEYYEYAKYNFIRAHFGLIGKAAKCGVSSDFQDWNDRRKNLVHILRKNVSFILKGKLSISRKVAFVICCIHPALLTFFYNLLKKNKKLETKC